MRRLDAKDRFLDGLLVMPNGCWDWQRSGTPKGYGQLHASGRLVYAHRFSYAFFGGALEPGLTIDHLCRNRGCVNPAHLEQVTNQENRRRARRDHCKAGHPLSGDNAYVDPRGRRVCRICQTRMRDAYRARLCAAGIPEATNRRPEPTTEASS